MGRIVITMDITNAEVVEGEIALIIHYKPGESEALEVLSGAMRLIEGLEAIDHSLLSSINTSLDPVSILNDVQHSSIKILLKRALKSIPDNELENLEWKKWIGRLLVKGKHKILSHLEADDKELNTIIADLEPDYLAAPNSTAGYHPPSVKEVRQAVHTMNIARKSLGDNEVSIQTEYGNIDVPYVDAEFTVEEITEQFEFHSAGRGLFKVKSPDMLGNAQWKILVDGKAENVKITHQAWLDDYHGRKINIAPHDSLDADYEQVIKHDENHEVTEKTITLTYIHRVVVPPDNGNLF